MSTPAIIMAVLILFGVVVDGYNYGRTLDYATFWLNNIGRLISVGLLWWGGFWR